MFQLFSSNPEKAWCEKFYIIYSCIWPIFFGAWCISGVHLKYGDIGNLLVSIIIALPNIWIPYQYSNWQKYHRHLRDTFFVKFNLWVFIFGFAMNYKRNGSTSTLIKKL